MVLLLLVAEEPDRVLQLLGGLLDVLQIFFAFLHHHLHLAEVGEALGLHIPADVGSGEGVEVDLSVDDLQ